MKLEVLATVDRGDTISELATKLNHSESYLSLAVADLVEKGLVCSVESAEGDEIASL
nr:helix-turn-helix domain-containing protein [Halorubrum ezzemoulense]